MTHNRHLSEDIKRVAHAIALVRTSERGLYDHTDMAEAAIAALQPPVAAEREAGRREGFIAGWWVNAAIPEGDSDKKYFDRCVEVDWQEYLRARVAALPATGEGSRSGTSAVVREGPEEGRRVAAPTTSGLSEGSSSQEGGDDGRNSSNSVSGGADSLGVAHSLASASEQSEAAEPKFPCEGGGGNDVIYCTKCGLEWEYAKTYGPPEPVCPNTKAAEPKAVRADAWWHNGHRTSANPCCSAIEPCSTQRKDPSAICQNCFQSITFARPTAWMRGTYQPSTPNGPTEHDVDLVYGDDQPEGKGWLPLYSRPAALRHADQTGADASREPWAANVRLNSKVAQLEAEVERLRSQKDGALRMVSRHESHSDAVEARAADLQARLAAAEAALRPFASIYVAVEERDDYGLRPTWARTNPEFTVGDIRRARSVLSVSKGGDNGK